LLARHDTENVSTEKHIAQLKSERILSTLEAEPHVKHPQPEQAKTRGVRLVSLLGASAIAGFAGYIYLAGANPFTRPNPTQTANPTSAEPPVSDQTHPTPVTGAVVPASGPALTAEPTATTNPTATAASAASSEHKDTRDSSAPVDLARSLEDGLKPQPSSLRTALEQTAPKRHLTNATASKGAPTAKVLPARAPNKSAQATDGDVNLLAALISHSAPVTKTEAAATSRAKPSASQSSTARAKNAEKKKTGTDAPAKTKPL